MIIGLILLGLLFILIFIGIPIAFSLGAVGVLGVFMLSGNPLAIIPRVIFSGISFYPLLAIPFFICAGELMNKAGITEKLVRFADLFVGKAPGGLAYTNILTSMFFGGITGSAAADTSAIGGLLIPAMVKEGYSKDFSVAVTASSSTVGPIIPPSIIMVIYGATVGVSIGALFSAGIVPGILIGVSLMFVVLFMSINHKFPKRTGRIKRLEAWITIREAIWPLGMPIIIIGGILGGTFTPTEAGAVGVLYSLLVGFFILKSIKISDIYPIFRHTALLTSTVLLIIGCAKILSWVLTVLQFQNYISQTFMQYSKNPIVFLILVNILLLIMGTFMDAGASVILLAPILAPIAANFGINPIHFGIITVLNLTIGHGTPPMGVCLFIATGIADISLDKSAKAIIPFIAAEIVVLMIITYLPGVVLYIPKLLGFV